MEIKMQKQFLKHKKNWNPLTLTPKFPVNLKDPFWLLTTVREWGWTARIAIARHAIARHFWQEINCSTLFLSTAWIQLILAKLDSSSWQKKCHLLDSVEQMTLSHATYKLKVNFFPIEMVNNFICRTCSWPKLPYLT